MGPVFLHTYLKRLLIITAIIICAPSTSTGNKVVLSPDTGVTNITRQIYYYRDTEETLTIKNINNKTIPFKKSLKANLNLGYTQGACWIKIDIMDLTGDEWFLELDYPHLDYVDLYYPHDNSYHHFSTGDRYNFDKRIIRHAHFYFPLKLKLNNPESLYLRIKTDGAYFINLNVLRTPDLIEQILREQIVFGFFYGIVIIIILYNIIFYLSIRDIIYLWYVLYKISGLFLLFVYNGHSFQFIWPHSPWWANYSFPFFIMLSIISFFIFSTSFLQLKKFSRGLYVVNISSIVFFAVLTIVIFIIPYKTANLMAITVLTAASLLSLLTGITVFFKKNRTAMYYLISWLTILSGAIIVGLRSLELLPYNQFTEYVFQIGFAIESVILTFAMGVRIDNLRREKEKAQAEVIQVQKKHAESLEGIVKERTRELEIEKNKLALINSEMQYEIGLARQIQETLIPDHDPLPDISSLYMPMREVGGDFYDFIHFPDSKEIGIFQSDVSGHGVHAAFITSMIKTILLQAGDILHDPAGFLYYMNDLLQNHIARNYITAFYGIYYPDDRTLYYSNAGHHQPFIITGTSVTQLQNGMNTAAAILPGNMLKKSNSELINYRETLEKNSKLLLFTDGFIEARSPDGNIFFENARMKDVLLANQNLPAKSFLCTLMEELKDYTGLDNFEDDICLICLDVM